MTTATTERTLEIEPLQESLRVRIVNRIIKEEDVSQDVACRILDQTLSFLTLCANEEGAFTPSPMVDIGWHAFILYTREYAAYCQLIARRFIHHVPDDAACGSQSDTPKQGPAMTMEAMGRFGLPVDEMLWTCLDKDCSNCNGGQGCQCGTCNYQS